MTKISSREIKRQYRVLRQTLSIHAMLRDEYSLKATVSQILILLCSVIFCATTFASDDLFLALKLSPETSRIVLGIASIMAFAFILVLIVFDWRGKSAQHRDAVERWSTALEKFRRYRTDKGTWPESVFSTLSAVYWEADRNSVKIPDNRFNSLKSRYLRKVAISKLKNSYPGCPKFILLFFLIIIDTYRAIYKIFKLNKKANNY